MRQNTIIWLASLLLAVLLAAGCGVVQQSSAEKKAEAARVASAVQQNLNARQFRINVEYMYPSNGGSRYVGGDGYALVVDGDKVKSHLPYMGVAYSVPYGGGKVLNFEDDIDSYSEEKPRDDRRKVVFSTDNGEDYIVFQVTVFDNGQADIQVRCKNRQQISFRGEMDTDAGE